MAIKPLEYGLNIGLEEAEKRYNEVKEEFESVKKHYIPVKKLGFFKRNMSQEDMNTLTACTGVLLPLGLEKSVQAEIMFKNIDPDRIDSTLWHRTGKLTNDIIRYMAEFKNTGVEVIESGDRID